MITLDELQRYISTQAAIRAIEEELTVIYFSTAKPSENQGGKASVRTAGDPTRAKAMRASEVRERLEAKQAELQEQLQAIEQGLTEIEDESIVAMIRLHYLLGYSWNRTCDIMYGYADRDYCRKAVKRYFRKLSALSASNNDIVKVDK